MENSNDLTRRSALKVAGSAAAAASALQGAPAVVKGTPDQVKFGIVGTGSRGAYLLKHLKGIDTGNCLAVCDVKDDALNLASSTIGTNPSKYKDYRELISRTDIDAVIVAVPLFMHYQVTKDALLAGKHVFCEKSLVFKAEQVYQLRELVASRPKQVMQVGLQRRYSAYYQAVKNMVDTGVLGTVTHMYSQWNRNPGWKMKPMPNLADQKMANWRLYKEYSGGMTAELASHQLDVAEMMFGSAPESVVGYGSHDFIFDGRDINDNIQMIYKYPKKQKLISMYTSTNSHLSMFGSSRVEFGEKIMGTAGSVEITIGDDSHPVLATWYREPSPPPVVTKAGEKIAKKVAGATMVAAGTQKGIPILLDKDKVNIDRDSFIDRETKFARQWLYSKGVLIPEEQKNPVDTELEHFFKNCKDGGTPLANVEIGLSDSASVILTNIAFEENRQVYWSELEKYAKQGGTPAPKKPATKG